MEASTTEKGNLITGDVVRVTLPSDDRQYTKIVLKIDSKYSQIGDENKIIGLKVPRSRRDSDETNVQHLDLNNDIRSGISTIFIQAIAVQLSLGGNKQVEIDVKSDDASYLHIGDRCKIFIEDAMRKAEVNDVNKSSACRRELFEPRSGDMMTRPVTRLEDKTKRKRKKPVNKTLNCNKKKPKEQIKTIPVINSPIDSQECLLLCQMFFQKVQKILHPLRDNGKWSLFDEKWNELMVEYGDDAIWKALLMLENGIRISYHSQFPCQSYLDEAEKTLREGRKIIEETKDIDPSIKQFFEGRFLCYLTSVYRRKKLYGKAQDSVDKAEQIFQNTDPSSFWYDKATVFYEKGSRYHEFDKRGVNNKEAKESLEKCYELCKQIRKETGCDFIEKGQLALLKKTMVLLGCSTIQGRERTISDEDREEAKKCIDDIDRENQTRASIPISEQLQLLLAKSDNYFRMKDFCQAEKKALQAVDLAEQHGFDSSPAKKRLQDIQDKLDIEEQRPTPQKDNVETVDQRVSCDADGSVSQSTGNSDSTDLDS